jgi:hypothetical protein
VEFTILGTTPFYTDTANEYVNAAYAVATFAAVATGEHDEIMPTDGLTIGVFNAISLLLAHAGRCLDGRG